MLIRSVQLLGIIIIICTYYTIPTILDEIKQIEIINSINLHTKKHAVSQL